MPTDTEVVELIKKVVTYGNELVRLNEKFDSLEKAIHELSGTLKADMQEHKSRNEGELEKIKDRVKICETFMNKLDGSRTVWRIIGGIIAVPIITGVGYLIVDNSRIHQKLSELTTEVHWLKEAK